MKNKYSIILGNLGNTKDRFCNSYKTELTTEEMLARAVKDIPGMEGIELVGTWDIRPDNASDMKKRLNDYGLICSSIIPDTFTDKIYSKGSLTSTVPEVRQKALDYLRQMAEIASRIDCKLLNLWLGQDGYDYLLTSDYDLEREWMKESLIKLAGEFPGLQIALEYKPKEPRNFSYQARMADTILAALETKCENIGVTMDTGHAFVAGENVADAVVLAKRAGSKLYHMHFNDNHGSWDDDMIVGSVHTVAYIELIFWLKKIGYTGWYSMDQYPYREDATRAIAASIAWVKKFEQIVDQYYAEIESLIKLNDALETNNFLLKIL